MFANTNLPSVDNFYKIGEPQCQSREPIEISSCELFQSINLVNFYMKDRLERDLKFLGKMVKQVKIRFL